MEPLWDAATFAAVDIGAYLIAVGGSVDDGFPWMVMSPDGISWQLLAGWPGSEEGCVDGLALGPQRLVVGCAMGPLAWAVDLPATTDGG